MRSIPNRRANNATRNDPMAPQPTTRTCKPFSRRIQLILRNPAKSRANDRGCRTEGAGGSVTETVEIRFLVVPRPAAGTLHRRAAWLDHLATAAAQDHAVCSGE